MRLTADTTQIAVRIHEDSSKVRANESEGQACLLDLQKASPRINRPLLWKTLEKYGLNGLLLNRLKDT